MTDERPQEFYTACQLSQQKFMDAIPWAQDQASRARQAQVANAPEGDQGTPAASPPAQLKEEALVQVLMTAQADLTDAFRIYDGSFLF